VLLTGWSGTAATYDPLIEALAPTSQVFAIAHRGHGDSDRPPDGYRVERLAADLLAVLGHLELEDVTLLGHSAGVAVIWSALDVFGSDRISSLILVDQMPCALADPDWTDSERDEAGATIDTAGLFGFTNGLRSADGESVRGSFFESVTSDGIDPDRLTVLRAEGARFPLRCAADLLHDVATRDWRPFIPTIQLPTMVVAGNSPNVPIDSQRWIQAQITGSRFEVVEGVSGGTHYPFVERPDDFAAVISDFLSDAP
jgi:pimeloyl-ACP methyl ester carboxylesterase